MKKYIITNYDEQQVIKFKRQCEGIVKHETYISQDHLVTNALSSGLFSYDDIQNIDNDEEVLDRVLISEWLAKKLIDAGAMVLMNDFGNWWFRNQDCVWSDDPELKKAMILMNAQISPELLTLEQIEWLESLDADDDDDEVYDYSEPPIENHDFENDLFTIVIFLKDDCKIDLFKDKLILNVQGILGKVIKHKPSYLRHNSMMVYKNLSDDELTILDESDKIAMVTTTKL